MMTSIKVRWKHSRPPKRSWSNESCASSSWWAHLWAALERGKQRSLASSLRNELMFILLRL